MDVEALPFRRHFADQELRAFLDALRDIARDLLKLGFGSDGAELHLLILRIPDRVLAGDFLQLRFDRRRFSLRNQEAAERGAGLSGIEEDRVEEDMNRLIVIRDSREHDVRGLPAELETHALHGFQRVLRHGDAALGRPGEGHHIDERMRGEGISDFAAAARNEVKDALRETGRLDRFREVIGGERRMLARLQNYGVPHEERRDDLLNHLSERIVPGGDAANHTDRLAVRGGGAHLFNERHRRSEIDIGTGSCVLVLDLA